MATLRDCRGNMHRECSFACTAFLIDNSNNPRAHTSPSDTNLNKLSVMQSFSYDNIIIPSYDMIFLNLPPLIVYPMNALANSQHGELEKFLCHGYPNNKGPVTFARYTGQESDQEKRSIIAAPPDILLTNYVMLELLLTRPQESALIQAAQGLHFCTRRA